MGGGLPVLSWYQDRGLKTAKRVNAGIAYETATSASSEGVGLAMRTSPVRRTAAQRRAGRLEARGHREPRPAYSPEGYFIRQATQPKPEPVSARPKGGRSLTSTIRSARREIRLEPRERKPFRPWKRLLS